MIRKKTAFSLLAVFLLFGCISMQETEEINECESPYVQIGKVCCIDEDDNKVCDITEDRRTTTTLSTTSTTYAPPTQATTSTLLQTRCIENSDCSPCGSVCAFTEAMAYKKCMPPRVSCICANGVCITTELVTTTIPTTTTTLAKNENVMKLSFGYKQYLDSGYDFRFLEKTGTGSNIKYKIGIRTSDGLVDERPLSTGESFIDYLRFSITNYGEDVPEISVRVNTEDLIRIPEGANLLTLGGISCSQEAKGLCMRKYSDHTIWMQNREENGANIKFIDENGLEYDTKLFGEQKAYSFDRSIVIGGFFDREHFIQGGYNLFYVYTN